MADKDVASQSGKSHTVSDVSSGKKVQQSDKPLPAKAGSSSQMSENVKFSSKDSNKDPPLREVLEVLRVMNQNVVAQGERLNKQDERLDEMFGQLKETTFPQEYDYTDSQCDDQIDYENYDESSISGQSEQVNPPTPQAKSIFKVLSDKFNQSESLDVSVHPDLASLVNNSFRNGLTDEKYEELSKEINRPENCDSLVKTRVNQDIWRLLKSWTQADDSMLSSLQGVLLKASTNVVKLMERLGSAESEHLELGTTSVALLGHAHKLITVKRKELHRNDLDSKYHYLTSVSLPYTDLLYGDDTDVNSNVREINTMNRIGKTVGRGGPMRGYGRGRRARASPYYIRGTCGRGRGGQTARTSFETVTMSKKMKPQKKQ